jgi:hypothetical protein
MIVFYMIYGLLQGKDLIIYRILILQGFLTFQKDQLNNNPYFTRIL